MGTKKKLTLIRIIFLIFRYLQEIGYTDTIIDVRSNRVRSLLGLNNNTDSEDINTPAVNGNESSLKATRNANRQTRNSGGFKKVEVNNNSILFYFIFYFFPLLPFFFFFNKPILFIGQ